MPLSLLLLRRVVPLWCCLALCFGRAAEDHEICPWTHPWAWIGHFDLENAIDYQWTFAKVDGEYAHDTMRFVMLPEGAAMSHDLFEGVCPDKFAGDVLTAAPAGTCHHLVFSGGQWSSAFVLQHSGHLSVYTEELPQDFEAGCHYLKDPDGADVEAEEEFTAEHCVDDALPPSMWGHVIGGAIVTVIPSILPFVVLPCCRITSCVRAASKYQLLTLLNCFACGVLFAAALFLLLSESLLLLLESGMDEVRATWVWGTSNLGGWFFGMIVGHVTSVLFGGTSHSHGVQDLSSQGEAESPRLEDDGSNAKKSTTLPDAASIREVGQHGSQKHWIAVAGPVLFGDFWHNLADGFVIGIAYRNCGTEFAWKLVGVTLVHEIPQEVADVAVLINRAGLRIWVALLLNFLSSLSTVVGALIGFGVPVDDVFQGVILAFGAGTYLFVALTEIGPEAASVTGTRGWRLWLLSLMQLLVFVLGAVVVGLVLLDHKHCSAGSAVSGDGGHAH